MRFDLDTFVAKCQAAIGLPDAIGRIAQVVGTAIAEPDAVVSAIEARKASVANAGSMAQVLLNDEGLTIYQLSFPPFLWGVPHDHATWSIIGVYAGAEAFNVYREENGFIAPLSRQVIAAGEVMHFPADLIHDIENPTATPSGSIHVYGNRHFEHPARRIWRSERASAEAFSAEKALEYGLIRTRERRAQLGLRQPCRPE